MNPNIVNLTKQMIIIHDNRRADNDRVVAVVPPGKKELSVGVIYRRMRFNPRPREGGDVLTGNSLTPWS